MSTIERHEAGAKFPVDAEHLHRYAFAAEIVNNKIVLDIACGVGYGSNIMAQYASNVMGVDIDKATVDQAASIYQQPNLSFECGSLLKIPAESESFDVVVSFETLEHIREHEMAIAEIKRVLKPGGLLILSTPNKLEYNDKPGYQNPFHVKELYRDELSTLLASKFHFTTWYAQRFYHASLIASEEQISSLKIYHGSSNAIYSKKPKAEPVFFITISSDSYIPPLDNSMFDLSGAVNENHRQEVEKLYNSRSYRFGNFFVRAANLFKKKRY